jgi:magnesium-transporting ATPase (P-type)
MVPADAVVTRGGHDVVIPASQLVIGDLVKLKPGSRVPADLRLVYVTGLKVARVMFPWDAAPSSGYARCLVL